MEQLFFSPNNFNNIRDALDKYSQNKYSRELASEEDNKIHKIMKYVKSKVSDEIPPGYTPQTYNQLMNRKVLDLFVSFKNDEEKQNHKQIVNHPATKYSSTANSIFDQQLIKNNDIPTDFLPPPSIQNNNQIPITQQLEDVNQQRSELDPKIKNIDFSIKTEENDIDQNKMYQDMIQQRGISANSTPSMLVSDNMPNNIIQPDDGFSNNMDNFQSTNELINKKLDSALEHMESYSNEQYTNIEDLRESDIVDSNMKLNNNDDTAGLPNNLERNNVELVIKKSDDPKNMFYNEDKKVEEALHKINTKTLSEHYETPVILPKQFKTYNDKFYITIDSRDRNLEIYPNPSNFQVKFSPASDSIEKQEVLDSNNNIIYETTVRYLGNLTGASIGRTYSNILELQLLHCIVPFGLGWVCGNSPDSYYDSQCKGSTSSICIPYGPVYSSNTGIAVSILNEPYLLLNIDEIQGPYEGTNTSTTNAFAKLILASDWKREYFFSQISSFVYMSTAGNESYRYKPTNLGTIDKMTLKLKRCDGELYEFGNDKIYVTEICEGSPNKRNKKIHNTKIIVQSKHSDYINCELEDLTIIPGDLLYFYDTRPKEAHMIRFHKDVNLSCMDVLSKKELNKYSLGICNGKNKMENTGKLSCKYLNKNNSMTMIDSKKQKYVKIEANICKIENRNNKQTDIEVDNTDCNNIKEYKVDFGVFLEVGNYLALVYKDLTTNKTHSELLKVYCIDRYTVITIKPQDYNEKNDIEILRFGFAENYNRGMTVPEKSSLFSRCGHRACCIKNQCDVDCDQKGDNKFQFEIDYPYENLPEYIKNKCYFENEIFFIQQKLQISYTFQLTEVRKEGKEFDSLLVKNA